MRPFSRKRLTAVASLLCLVVLLNACAIGDCGWGSSAKAWIDVNENGIWDADEPPLPGVKFWVDNTQAQHMNTGFGGKSNSKGESTLFVGFGSGCGLIDYSVYPEIPTGYRLTTQSPLSVRGMPGADYGPYFFGFTYLPGMPTATPRPPAPACTSYEVGNNKVSDLVVTATSVWVTTDGGGAAKLDLRTNEWVTYTTRDGLANDKVRAIDAKPDGSVWFGTDGGATYYDGKIWRNYTSNEGLVSDNIYDVALDSEDMVWFATQHGISRFDPHKNGWTNYTSIHGLPDEFVIRVAPAADGSIWFTTVLKGVVRLMPNNQRGQPPKWLTYSRYTDPKNPLGLAEDIKTASDGTVWFAYPGITTFDPTSETWTHYDYQNTDGALPDGTASIAFAPDGTVWIGTRAGAIHYIIASNGGPFDTWLLFNTQDGLASDRIASVAVGSNGDIWFGTDKGATRCIFPTSSLSSLILPVVVA